MITVGERRRWSIEQKREIVAESLAPGAMPSQIVRKYGISTGQLYTWRRQIATRVGTGPAASFARVAVVTTVQQPEKLTSSDDAGEARTRSTPLRVGSSMKGLIEIVQPSGAVIRVDAHVDAAALRRVLEVLNGR